MSLMNTMTKMAIGFAVAKGMDAVQRRGGMGAVLDEIKTAGTAQGGGLGGLDDLLGGLGGANAAQGGAGGALGGLLGQLTGGGAAQAGSAAGLGGLGALIGGLAGARSGATTGDFETLVNQGNPNTEPDEDQMARLMLRAMMQAMRADGDIDPTEKEKLLTLLREGDAQDVETVQALMEEPVDPVALAADTPHGLETQVYTMAVNAISPDNPAEIRFLASLSQALRLPPDVTNGIHDGLQVPRA